MYIYIALTRCHQTITLDRQANPGGSDIHEANRGVWRSRKTVEVEPKSIREGIPEDLLYDRLLILASFVCFTFVDHLMVSPSLFALFFSFLFGLIHVTMMALSHTCMTKVIRSFRSTGGSESAVCVFYSIFIFFSPGAWYDLTANDFLCL